jgi:hypothetical protein
VSERRYLLLFGPRKTLFLTLHGLPGPSELSIAAPEAVNALYGTKSPVSKGPWYELLEPRYPVFMERDKEQHTIRRKVWDQAFTTKGEVFHHV